MSGILAALAGIKTAIATAVDEYFNRTTLLLNTSSTNGAQNNTFLDSSTNNFTITRNGNTTQGTFTPFSQTGWSNNFVSGSSQGLSVADNANLRLGSGDFTVECWFYMAGNSSLDGGGQARASLISKLQNDPTNWAINIDAASTTTGTGLIFNFLGTQITYTGTIAQNTWHHVAVVRSGTSTGNIKIYLNGTSVASGTSTTTDSNTGAVTLGWWDYPASGYKFYFNGYISNARIVKGTAVYTSNFTPSTTPLTAITNTQLLTCQSNRFADSSTNAFAITTVGTPSVQAFSPFAPTAAYDSTVVGGSGYFDGSGDYLTLSNNAAFTFGTGDFTIETWIYPTAIGTNNNIFFTGDNSTGQANLRLNAGKVEFFADNSSPFILTGATTLKVNTWSHIVFSRVGSTNRIFVNGVQDATATNSYSYSGSGSIQIGYWSANAGSNYFTGYMTGLRVLKGTGYSSISVPTTPPTAITNTSLLINYTNSGIYDSTAKNVLETVGNAQVSTTQAKWGTTSMYFDGSSTATLPSRQTLSLGSGNFTIECWVRLSSTGTETNIGQSKNYYTAGSNGNFVFRVGTSNLWRSFDGQSSQATIDGSYSWSTGVWYHVAWVRNSGTVTVYRDGTSLGSVSDSKSLIDSANGITLCSGTTAYIDDLRITVGLARYTTTFTPPTAAFPLQ